MPASGIQRPTPAQRRRPKITRDADATRTRIHEAAKVRFSGCSYEGVGLREIAADAGVDAALVVRYFGSKEGLFRAVAAQAFDAADLLVGGPAQLADNAVCRLLGEMDAQRWRAGYDPLRLLLASIGSPIAGPILAQYLEAGLVRPLATASGGPAARERGVMLAALIVGLAVMRVAAAASETEEGGRATLARLLRKAIQASQGL